MSGEGSEDAGQQQERQASGQRRHIDADSAAARPHTGGAASDRAALYSMGALTKLSAADMQLILSYYVQPGSSERYVRHCELSGGLSNSNYRLHTTDRSLLCKVCDEKTVHALVAQVTALLQLQQHNLPIAYPISRTDLQLPAVSQSPTAAASSLTAAHHAQSYILTLDPWKPIIMYQFLDGTPPTHVTADVMRQIGQVSPMAQHDTIRPWRTGRIQVHRQCLASGT